MPSNEQLMKRINELSEEIKELRNDFRARNRHLHGRTWDLVRNNPARVDPVSAKLLMQIYREQAAKGEIHQFGDVAYSNFSQFGEDGVLEYIFELIGTTNKLVVEMCCGQATECNATNLIINHNWFGLLFDGDEKNISNGKVFFNNAVTSFRHPKLVNEWITRSNINELIASHGFSGEIDLFSLDIDGNDYWLLNALSVISPRVIILEAQMMLGPDREYTVPYDDNFVVGTHEFDGREIRMYSGASVRAYVNLCKRKGYRLVGHVGGISPNIIFIKDGVGEAYFPEIAVEDVFAAQSESVSDHYDRVCETSFENFEWVDLTENK